MKVITTNLLNRFWKNGVLEKLKLKVDTAKIVNNFTTTVAGNVADARALKTLRDLITGLQNETDELNGKSTWKNLIQITNAQGKSFALPQGDWSELKILSVLNNGTNCILETTIIKAIVVDTAQYIGATVYANQQSFDTVIFAFSEKGVTVHNMLINNGQTSGVINVFYR